MKPDRTFFRLTLGNVVSIIATVTIGVGVYYGLKAEVGAVKSEVGHVRSEVSQQKELTEQIPVIQNNLIWLQRDVDSIRRRIEKPTASIRGDKESPLN